MVSAAVIAMGAQASHAGSFSLYTESSAAAIGNYAAGIAAEAADASIGWYNPAGLVLIKKPQLLVGGVGVLPSMKLSGTSTYTTINTLIPPEFQNYVSSFNNLQGSQNAVVPSFHYALPLGERAAFGLSIVSPFGLSTNYGENSPVRYAATLSKLETVLVSPELAGKLSDHLSIGAGLNFQYASVEFNREIGSPALLTALSSVVDPLIQANSLDSSSHNSGDSFGIGVHVGVLWMFDENHTRIGINYQSDISQQFNGQSQLTGRLADPSLEVLGDLLAANPNAQFTSNSLQSNFIDFPDVITLSAYRDVTQKLALLGSVVYSGWSSFKSISLTNVAAVASDTDGNIHQTLTGATTPEDYRQTWRFALGANYHVTPQWMMRVGGGYDQTPTVDNDRDVRLPDCNRWALAIGTHYQMKPSLGFDLGYSYLFAANNAKINNTQAIGASSQFNVNAIAQSHAQLIGLQAVWTM